jgi:SAM-dependent methyltransferase
MIVRCPICGSDEFVPVWRSNSPLLPIASADRRSYRELFAEIEIVICQSCGHANNRAFDAESVTRMYGDVALTNIPVDPTMNRRLEELAAWLTTDIVENRHVIEIGAGGGHLARLIAKSANTVSVVEPCRALTSEMLPEPNIELIHDLFPTNSPLPKADLILARQVLEHVADPQGFLSAVTDALAENGYAYVEVPAADYIGQHGAILDLHAQHVNYFDFVTLIELGARFGLVPVRSLSIKDGHDFGVLFRRAVVAKREVSKPISTIQDKVAQWRTRLMQRAETLARFRPTSLGRIALYGATMHGTVFLNMLPWKNDPCLQSVFDDNPGYGYVGLYTPKRYLPVVPPTIATVQSHDTIIIVAYLHDIAISRKLRALGFCGQVLTVRVQPYEHQLGRVGLLFDELNE